MFDKQRPDWFQRVLWLGIVADILIGLFGVTFTTTLLVLLRLPLAQPLLWPRFAAFLVICDAIFCIPAALDPARNLFTTWFAVITRYLGLAFFVVAGGGYIIFGVYDFIFGLPQAILFARFLRRRNETSTEQSEY